MSRFLAVCLLFLLVLMPAGARAQNGARPRATTVFRGLHLLGDNASITRVTAVKPTSRLARTASGSLALTSGSLRFNFQGFTSAQKSTLESYVNAQFSRMTAIYGAPAPEQIGKTVTVINDEDFAPAYAPPLPGSSNGGTIYFVYNDAASRALNQFNFTRLALISFQGPRVPAFDFRSGNYVEPWLYGLSDAAALLVAYGAAGSPANFDPSQLGAYVLPIYDYLNTPELGNAYIYPRNGDDLVVADFRLAMAQAAFLKIAVENPDFFTQFNAALYRRGAAGDPITPAQLQSLAGTVVPTVEGQSFNDWARGQYALDSQVTTGQKLYLALIPLPSATTGDARSGFSGFAQAFTTNSDGGETASSGYGSVRAFDPSGSDVSALSTELRASNVINFGASGAPGQASFGAGFSLPGTSDRALLAIKVRLGQAEATNYFPYGATGNTNSTSSIYGGTLGGQSGTLRIRGALNQNVAVTRGAWTATQSYPSGPRVQTTFAFGGATLQRNTAWLSPGDSARSVAFLLRVPSDLQTFNFSAPAGASRLRMVSLPFFPLQTDEAQTFNINATDLALARYRPNLSPITRQGDALLFGIGGDRYEIYPDISTPPAPGRGYWLGVETSGYATSIQGSQPPLDQPYEVPLIGGWNQIGVPFNRAFSIGSIKVRYGGFAPVALDVAQSRGWVARGVWRWLPAGGYVRADVAGGQLAPFEGYFLFAGANRGVSLVFDPNASSVASDAPTAAAATDGWSVSLVAKGAFNSDLAARFGISSAPDIAAPPTASRVVTLRFQGADAQNASASGSGLAESYRPELSAGARWNFVVDGTANGERVALSWGDLKSVPANVKLVLLDGANNRSTVLVSGRRYSFVSKGAPRHFTLTATPLGAPSAQNAELNLTTSERGSVVLTGSDPDGGAVTFERVGEAANGNGNIRRDSDGQWKLFYRSRGGFVGTDEVRFVAVDAQGRASAVAKVTIQVTAPSGSGSPSSSGGGS